MQFSGQILQTEDRNASINKYDNEAGCRLVAPKLFGLGTPSFPKKTIVNFKEFYLHRLCILKIRIEKF